MVSLQKALNSCSFSRRFLFFYIVITFILLVATGYYSYKAYETENLTIFNVELEKVRNSVEKAETRFESYLKFLGKIISDSKNDRAKILQALRFDYLSISNNESPKILNISFIPFNKTEAPITRLGEMNPPHKQIDDPANSTQNTLTVPFRLILKDPVTHSPLGTIEGNRNYNHLVPQKLITTHTEKQEKRLQINLMTGQSISLSPPLEITFLSYLQKKYKWILLTLITCLGACFLCLSYSSFLSRLKRKNILNENSKFKRNNEILMAELIKYKEKLDAKKHKYDLLKNFHTCREEILNDTVTRYQAMASQGLGINSFLSKIFMRELNNNKTNEEIKNISDEVSVIMRKITKNQLMKIEEDTHNIQDEIQSIISGFEIFFMDMNTTCTIKCEDSVHWKTDKGLLKFIIFNILNLITSRLMTNNKIEIHISCQNDLEINFTDDGYIIQNIEISKNNKNILSIGRDELVQLAESLGWRIVFESSDDKNSTTLYIPDQNKKNHGNIISMFERAKHAK